MNSHLNIFKTYTNSYREYQLENDLTRAFAITLQEDSLFLHEILKEIFKGTKFYKNLFESLENNIDIEINIQQKTSNISEYEYIFAISLSEYEMKDFWEQSFDKPYDPICDLVIKINGILLIFEAKRNSVNCTEQLYNQIFNIIAKNGEEKKIDKINYDKIIFPIDLSWPKLMSIAVNILTFEKATNSPNRFLFDFINLVKQHNFRWLPESPIAFLSPDNKPAILRRLESAVEEINKKEGIRKLNYGDRLGFEFPESWAKELLLYVDDKGNLSLTIYPGNTKSQGYAIFNNKVQFSNRLNILGQEYEVKRDYHIKFSSFQRYFTGLWFSEEKIKGELYTQENFIEYTGRKKRNEWGGIAKLFDEALDYDWKEQCNWENLMIHSGKKQFDISFGYEIYIQIPFKKLKMLDSDKGCLNDLVEFITETYQAFRCNLLQFK